MKKFVSLLVSAAIGTSAVSVTSVSAAGKTAAKEKTGMVVLGDSIASGYNVKGQVPYNYGTICGDYLGCDVSNYAVPTSDTEDLLAFIDGMTAAQKSNVADAEYIVVSIGGNDIAEYVAKRLLTYAAKKEDQKFLNEGYTADDIPEKPGFTAMMKMLNIKGEGGIVEYAGKGLSSTLEISNVIGSIGADISSTKSGNEGYIANKVIPNVQEISDRLKAINPDAKILVQNVYQPFQFEPTYIASTYGSTSTNARMINIIRAQVEVIMNAYDEGLKTVDGIDVVDVKAQFTSLDKEPSIAEPGHANYFIDIQTGSISTADIHPNQKGHLAIAAAVLEKIGKLHDDDGLLSKIYDGLSDKDKYPEIALGTYKKVAENEGIILGDVNNDTHVDSVDASQMLKEYTLISTGKTGTFDELQKKAGDLDENGAVDSVDASKVLSYYTYASNATGEIKSLKEYIKK